MKTVWVTGAHGFLGRNLCRYLSGHDFCVIGIGHGHWKPGEAQAWGVSQWFFSEVHLAALYDIGAKTDKPQAIFHIAGGSSVPLSLENPYLDYQRTVGTTIDVLEFARLNSPETKIIYPSSAAVYGSINKDRISEKTPLKPVSPYGVHKKIAEYLCLSYGQHFSIATSVVRLFSVYGIGLRKQLLWDACSKLSRNEVTFFGTGHETRDWLHVNDAVELLYMAGEHASPNCPIVNGGTGLGTTINEILTKIFVYFHRTDSPIFTDAVRQGDPLHYMADISLAKSWGWIPKVDWVSGIRAYVEWFKKGAP